MLWITIGVRDVTRRGEATLGAFNRTARAPSPLRHPVRARSHAATARAPGRHRRVAARASRSSAAQRNATHPDDHAVSQARRGMRVRHRRCRRESVDNPDRLC
ncbi:hypothetical protein BSIN_2976 [Burkholderia singularis]|uniref:Uncharacterized protein n=1 Tax=Burkholderia singularis TaxID=1503053 RepID=A0A238H3H3_9BURK|nr:hypothetical protein BSIN_2976 [Burkholderia singularis]